MKISKRLKDAIRTSDEHQYKLAQRIGVSPSVISCWIHGVSDPRPDDPRVVKLGEILGVPGAACFEHERRKNDAA